MKPFKLAIFFLASFLLVADAHAAAKKVYLVNGLLSRVFGYGLTNLSKKIPYARHFKFTGSVTQSTINGIIKDATNAYKSNPSVQISLIGISQGANAVTKIASALNRKGVNVHYLGIIEGGTMSAIPSNVKKADNFICTNSNCSKTPIRRGSGNSVTRMKTFNLNTGHIDSGNHPTVHRRVISQINSN